MGSTSTTGTGTWYFSIPSGLTIDSTKTLGDNLGVARGFCAGANALGYDVNNATTTTLSVIGPGGYVTNTYPGTWVSTNTLYIEAKLPIVQYTANINLVQSFTEYVSCDGTVGVAANTVYNPTTVYGSQGSLIPSVTITSTTATTQTGYNLVFSRPVLPTDLIQIEINDGNGWTPISGKAGNITCANVGNIVIGMVQTLANSTTVQIGFSNAGRCIASGGAAAAFNWAGLSTWSWRVRKTSQGNFAQGSPAYSTTIGDGVSTTITVTHNLGVTDCNVSIFELTGNKRKVDSGVEIRSISTTQISLVFATAPASNSLRVTVFSSGGTSSNVDNYSTSEVMTNKTWIDGKTIYRKVIALSTMPNNTTKTVAHGISGASLFVKVDGFMYLTATPTTVYAFNQPNATVLANSLTTWVDATNFNINTASNWSTFTGYAILEYVK